MIRCVGELTGKASKASQLIAQINAAFSKLQTTPLPLQAGNHQPQTKTAYLIWHNPYMTVGGDTFIHDMMTRCGLLNIFAGATRYPEITTGQLKENNCELLLLSSEPYPFKQQHITELQQQLPGVTILLADGEMFSWYGSRLLLAPEYFRSLLQQIN
jgi:ABC-type Fe3+-hydroxamate transport system substrate-binding protein